MHSDLLPGFIRDMAGTRDYNRFQIYIVLIKLVNLVTGFVAVKHWHLEVQYDEIIELFDVFG